MKGGFIHKIDGMQIGGLPFGRAIVWSTGFGLSRAIASRVSLHTGLGKWLQETKSTQEYVRPIVQSVVALISRLGPVKRLIGENLSTVIAVTSLVDVVDAVISPRSIAEAFIAKDNSGMYTSDPLATFPGGVVEKLKEQLGTKGLGDVDTLIPVEGGYDQFQGLGASQMLLTSVEGKLSSIAG